jgi:hypothetical protein
MIPIYDSEGVKFNPHTEYALHFKDGSEQKLALGKIKVIIPDHNDFLLSRFNTREEALAAYTAVLGEKNKGILSKKPAPVSAEQAEYAFKVFLGIVCYHAVPAQIWFNSLYENAYMTTNKHLKLNFFHPSFGKMPRWMVAECEDRYPHVKPMLEDCVTGINIRRVSSGMTPLKMELINANDVPSATYLIKPEKAVKTPS